MAPLERLARFNLWGMCPAYVVYFAVQIGFPTWLTTTPQRLAWFAAIAGVHAAVYLAGLFVVNRKEHGEALLADERDRAIEARANRLAYYLLMSGLVVVGMIMPFGDAGWKIVNAAVLAIVCAETLRHLLIVQGYRGTPRLAH